MVFHWRLSDSKSPQVSRTLVSILSVMLLFGWSPLCHQLPNLPGPQKSFCYRAKAPITIGIIITFMFHSAGLCIYHLLALSNLNFLYISQWITLPTQSCLALYSFSANLLHSLIMWLMVWSLSRHSLHLLFCCILSILALIWLVLMALFCAAIRRESGSLLMFPFLSHVRVLSCEILFISRLKRPWSCFPSHFCFLLFVILLSIVLSVLFPMAVISPRSRFSM